MRNTDRRNDNRRVKVPLEKYVTLALFVTFACERELETEHNCNILTPHSYGRQRCVFLVLLMLNQKPGGSVFCWVLAFSTTYCHQRVSKTTGGPKNPFGREWIYLPHLISKFSGPQLIRGSKGPIGLLWLSLLHLVYNSSVLQLSDFCLDWVI